MDPDQRRMHLLTLALSEARTRERLLAVEDPSALLEDLFTRCAGESSDPAARARSALATLADLGARAILAADEEYPHRLARIRCAPAVLFAVGELPLGTAVGIVGSRGASAKGIETARRLGRELAAAGLVVVSGGAIGIDAAAHEGALEAGGATVAILGGGLDRLYPERNLDLFARIPGRGGALVSPYAPGTPPARSCFPRRNRLIAAWSSALVVVEAGARSGALSTARWAHELAVPVLAVAGSVGTQRLLRLGALPAVSAEEVAAVARGEAPPGVGPEPALDPDGRALLEELRPGPRTLGQLLTALGWSGQRTAAVLLRLELDGWVERTGGRYGRVGAGSS
jgi:DNA processing protein